MAPPLLWLCVFGAALSSFQFGWHIGVLNIPATLIHECPIDPATAEFLPSPLVYDAPPSRDDLSLSIQSTMHPVAPDCISMSDGMWNFVVAVFSLGGLFGGLAVPYLTVRAGRKPTFVVTAVLYALSAGMMWVTTSVFPFLFARWLAGVATGISAAMVPIYLNEIAPPSIKSILGLAHQLSLVFGLLMSQIVAIVLSTPTTWRYLVSFSFWPALVQLLFLATVMLESPRYLYLHHRDETAAITVLSALRDAPQPQLLDEIAAWRAPRLGSDVPLHPTDNESDVHQPLLSRHASVEEGGLPLPHHANRSAMSVQQLLRDTSLAKPVRVTVLTQVSQQWSGINGIIQYSHALFLILLGGDVSSAQWASVGLNGINLGMTILAAFIIERYGRHHLLLASQISMAAASMATTLSALTGWASLSTCFVIVAVAAFAVGLGPIPWLMIPDMFPGHAVEAGMSLATSMNWFCAFLVSYVFHFIQASCGVYTFALFGGFLCLGALYTHFEVTSSALQIDPPPYIAHQQ